MSLIWIGEEIRFSEAARWARTLANLHDEPVIVRKHGDKWGLFVEKNACLFEGWRQIHDPAFRPESRPDPRWSEHESIRSDPDWYYFQDED